MVFIIIKEEHGLKSSFQDYLEEEIMDKMRKNVVVEILEKIAGTNKVEFMSGEILNIGSNECELSNRIGSVYGIAIKIPKHSDKKQIFNCFKNKNIKIKIEKVEDWKEIGDNFYPLYWGKDSYMGKRLYDHTKSRHTTYTLQLNNKDNVNLLKNHTIIYGALPCVEPKKIEYKLHSKYPHLLNTRKG